VTSRIPNLPGSSVLVCQLWFSRPQGQSVFCIHWFSAKAMALVRVATRQIVSCNLPASKLQSATSVRVLDEWLYHFLTIDGSPYLDVKSELT
jgi:hypothetical protein